MEALAPLWLLAMFGALYLLLIRPQRKQVAAHQALMASLEVGDQVMTMGGIYGRIKSMEGDIVELEVGPGTALRVARTAIGRKVEGQ